MSLVFVENCCCKKNVLLFLSGHATRNFYQSKQQMVLNAICFLLSSLIENMATILINFQQKFVLVKSFQEFASKFLNQKRFLAPFKSASKFSLSWRGKCDVVSIELYLAINPSSLAGENDVTELSELQIAHCLKITYYCL